MKTTHIFSAVLAAALMTVLPAAAQAPSGKPICVNVKDIRDTVSRDQGKTLVFQLRNGTTMVNTLRPQCDGLTFTGFAWVTPPGGEICENAQTLRVIGTGEICRLGKFSAPVKSAAQSR